MILATEKLFGFLFYFIPFFNVMKLLAVIYLSMPGLENPMIVYRHYVKFFLNKYEPTFSAMVSILIENINKSFATANRKIRKQKVAEKIDGKIEEIKNSLENETSKETNEKRLKDLKDEERENNDDMNEEKSSDSSNL